MRFAVIAGIEGHYPALEVALSELSSRGIEDRHIICLGNVIGRFRWMHHCVERARQFALTLQGSRELLLRMAHTIKEADTTLQAIRKAYEEQLSQDDYKFLTNLPMRSNFFGHAFRSFPFVPTADQLETVRFFFRSLAGPRIEFGDRTIDPDDDEWTEIDVSVNTFRVDVPPIANSRRGTLTGSICYCIFEDDQVLFRRRSFEFAAIDLIDGISKNELGPYEPIPVPAGGDPWVPFPQAEGEWDPAGELAEREFVPEPDVPVSVADPELISDPDVRSIMRAKQAALKALEEMPE